MKKAANFDHLINDIGSTKVINSLLDKFKKGADKITIKHLSGSLKSVVTAAIWKKINAPVLILCNDKSIAEDWYHDLKVLAGEENISHIIKARKNIKVAYQPEDENLGSIIEGIFSSLSNKAGIAIATPDIFDIKLPSPNQVRQSMFTVFKGQEIDFESFATGLSLNGFERSDYVASQGEIAVRGGILDIFPLGWDNPLRIEFWGNEIESIREFNCISQRSVKELQKAEFINSMFNATTTETRADILAYLDPATICIYDTGEGFDADPAILEKLDKFRSLRINNFGKSDLEVKSVPQPKFSGSVKLFMTELEELITLGYKITICADGKIHLKRLSELLENLLTSKNSDDDDDIAEIKAESILNLINWIETSFSSGFILSEHRIACFTEHELFERLRMRDQSKQKALGITLRELKELQIGNLVVHEDKGVGRFEGFQTVKLGGSSQDCVRVVYDGGDVLYVSMNSINKLQKFSAQEGTVPKLSKLGSGDWLRKKERAKKKLKDIARELIKLYAERKTQRGFSFPADNLWQKEFEASFIYEDTIDQAKATSDVKADMELDSPMDRLICGDVGYGKTEVAIRAAFKAVQSGKQVAILVPTTILAQQHYMTFRDRLHKYPVLIDHISRFRTKQQQDDILKNIKLGRIDILIGTHRLLSKDIEFKDLGLLVVDEEHRFGVSAKEKLRQMRVNVDTLTLTATPIPRTLNFSLMGARDLSVIETPPRNRLPVYTEIIEWDSESIMAAINKEVERGGQVFFVNDRIEDLDKIAMDMQMMMPTLRVGIGHGQMKPADLEKIMEKFIQGRFDVLLSTKIIESGIDIPNANTMLINRANNFGLAELYQLRGRVGRNNLQAYCYLIIPETKKLPMKALQRLQAIEEFTDLGSGLKLAMRDLEIRGAGNLLGAEQSGFITDIGFELFQKILEEAVTELKSDEFSDLFATDEEDKPKFLNDDIQIELSSDAFLPSDYVINVTDRFTYYKKLYQVQTNAELSSLIEEIKDRFGKLPKEARELVFAVQIRIAALNTGITRVIVKDGKMVADFPAETNTEFYEKGFPVIADFIGEFQNAKLIQNRSKLTLEVLLDKREQAAEILWKIKKTLETYYD